MALIIVFITWLIFYAICKFRGDRVLFTTSILIFLLAVIFTLVKNNTTITIILHDPRTYIYVMAFILFSGYHFTFAKKNIGKPTFRDYAINIFMVFLSMIELVLLDMYSY
jgi:hypothetical protein